MSARSLILRLRELLHYGVARVPGEFAGSALFALGPVIASHYLPLSEVAHLLLGLGLLMAISLSITPCGTVLLSKISMMIARNQIEDVRAKLEQFVAGVLELSVFGCLQVIIFADVLVRLWVGANYLKGLDVIHFTLLSIPFFLYFVAVRSAIDAATVVAHNAHNGYVALAVFLLLSGVVVKLAPTAYLLDGLACALMIANAVLAWRTGHVAKMLFNLRIPWKQCAPSLLLAFLLGGMSFWVHRHLKASLDIVWLACFELLCTCLFLGLSIKLGSTWLVYFWQLFGHDGRSAISPAS
jgi:O-antigen/teichoic acid export membrane protein